MIGNGSLPFSEGGQPSPVSAGTTTDDRGDRRRDPPLAGRTAVSTPASPAARIPVAPGSGPNHATNIRLPTLFRMTGVDSSAPVIGRHPISARLVTGFADNQGITIRARTDRSVTRMYLRLDEALPTRLVHSSDRHRRAPLSASTWRSDRFGGPTRLGDNGRGSATRFARGPVSAVVCRTVNRTPRSSAVRYPQP